MSKYLITGFSGFVSRHFLQFLEDVGADAEVLGVSRSQPAFSLDQFRHVRCTHRRADLLDKAETGEILESFRPDYILHLAAYSSVGFSWLHPVDSFANNTNIFLNLLDQVRIRKLQCRILSVGSSEEYGNVTADKLPLREDLPLQPLSPYAVARVSQELLSKVYVDGYGLDVIMTRSFNHTGPHQRDAFVVPSFARQLVAIQRGGAPAKLVTGDESVVRDFVDVRDVVRAYDALFTHGQRGEVYNVCRGEGYSIESVLEMMQEILGLRVTLETNPDLVRPNDNKIIVGCREKILRAVGWEPQISMQQSLTAILEHWSASTP